MNGKFFHGGGVNKSPRSPPPPFFRMDIVLESRRIFFLLPMQAHSFLCFTVCTCKHLSANNYVVSLMSCMVFKQMLIMVSPNTENRPQSCFAKVPVIIPILAHNEKGMPRERTNTDINRH